MKIADFFAEIGFKVDTQSLQQFNSSMSTVVNTVKGLAFSLTSAMTAWELLQTKIGKNAQQMLNFKTYTGESIDDVRELAAVMQGVNINFSMDTLLSDISTLKTRLRELQIYGEGSQTVKAFRVLGLSGLNPGAISSIEDILGRLRQIKDPATRAMLMDQLGLSRQFLNILDLTDDEYKKLAARAPYLFPDEKELRRRQKASLEIFLTWRELVNLFESKVTDFSPILLDILKKLKDIVSDSDRLKVILETIKWTFILSTVLSLGVALGIILQNLRGIAGALGIIAGIKLAQKINEKLGVDNSSGVGIATQATLGVGGAAAVGGAWFGLKRLLSGGAATKGAAGVAGLTLTKAQLRTLGVTIGRQAGKSTARAVVGSGGNPYVMAGLALWGLFDIGKAIFDIVKTNQQSQNKTNKNSKDILSIDNNEQYDWNSTLANMTINAQNVYLNAQNIEGNTYPTIGRNGEYYYMSNEDYSQQQTNIVSTRYGVTGGW